MRKSALFVFGLVVTMIVTLGLVILSSASAANAVRLHGDAYYFMERQFVYLGIGILLATAVALFDYRNWRDHPSLVVMFFVVVMIGLCAVFGFRAINGSHRWVILGSIRIQPSEFAKLLTVIVISVWMDRIGWRVELFFRGAMLPAVIIGVIALPVLAEPDFGSVMVIGASGLLLMFVAGVRLLHLGLFGLGGVCAVAVAVINNANRMERIRAFMASHFGDATEVVDKVMSPAAYQAHHALVAIGNGGLWGVGLNNSMQKHLYLPEAHTDFIFAIGAEELGLPFSIAVMTLFIVFFGLSVYIALKASDRFGRYLVIGMAFVIFFQAVFNIGVVCEALPTKGMALPFFSYGGTNMMSAFFAVGTILSVGIHSYRDHKREFVRKVIMR